MMALWGGGMYEDAKPMLLRRECGGMNGDYRSPISHLGRCQDRTNPSPTGLILKEDIMICVHCGECEDVMEEYEYVGGIGYRKCLMCRDREECWRKWDKQNEVECERD